MPFSVSLPAVPLIVFPAAVVTPFRLEIRKGVSGASGPLVTRPDDVIESFKALKPDRLEGRGSGSPPMAKIYSRSVTVSKRIKI